MDEQWFFIEKMDHWSNFEDIFLEEEELEKKNEIHSFVEQLKLYKPV